MDQNLKIFMNKPARGDTYCSPIGGSVLCASTLFPCHTESFPNIAPNAISNFVALEFTGGGLDDIMEFAVNHQIRYFVQGAKIYVDARKEAGLFLILA